VRKRQPSHKFKSKLKHIDCRQHWVKTLRDKNIVIPRHVDTRDNLADIFTKILDKHTFQKLFSRLMTRTTQAKEAICN